MSRIKYILFCSKCVNGHLGFYDSWHCEEQFGKIKKFKCAFTQHKSVKKCTSAHKSYFQDKV
jgi:hypothetical protein